MPRCRRPLTFGGDGVSAVGLILIDHADTSTSSTYVDHPVLQRQNLAVLALRLLDSLDTATRVRIFVDGSDRPTVDTDALTDDMADLSTP